MLKHYKTHKSSIVWLRISLGILFLWLGVLKFLPTVSPAEDIVGRTFMAITLGYIKPPVSLPFLALWECGIAIGLLTGLYLRWVLVLFYLHMLGTFFPLIIFPYETWYIIPLVPTLWGQYIIKNIVLVTAGVVISKHSEGCN
jgi:uncharacterized membrane protein YphA (DoxX/SURF4 family)